MQPLGVTLLERPTEPSAFTPLYKISNHSVPVPRLLPPETAACDGGVRRARFRFSVTLVSE